MKRLLFVVAALLLAGCSTDPATPGNDPERTTSAPSATPTARTVGVAGYVIVEADYFGTLKAQRDQGGAACANVAAGSGVQKGAQLVVKDAAGSSIDILTLDQGYAQFPPGHTDASPANELACVYAFRSAFVAAPTDILAFELAGHPSVSEKVGPSPIRPQIKVGDVKGNWTNYRMAGD